MAKALLCPNCRTRYPLKDLGGEPTFPCTKCGQILKVPASVAPPDGNGSGTAVLGREPPAPDGDAPIPRTERRRSGKEDRREKRAAKKEARPRKVPWPLRILAWLVALPLGAVIVFYPARKFGLLSSVDLADVFIGSGNGRYARLAIAVVLWALAAAIIVQLLLVGGRALVDRWRSGRRARGDAPPRGPAGGVPEPAPAPSRRPAAPEPAPERVPVAAGTARSSQRLRTTAGRRTGS